MRFFLHHNRYFLIHCQGHMLYLRLLQKGQYRNQVLSMVSAEN
uniref:Uncharacterized protein n=1 Tax=Arundo donax TaxID=35708 RepID=A0A0A8ZMM6_ARUDO